MAREKQIEFPAAAVARALADAGLLLASLACIVIVVIILLAHPSGEFIGPW